MTTAPVLRRNDDAKREENEEDQRVDDRDETPELSHREEGSNAAAYSRR